MYICGYEGDRPIRDLAPEQVKEFLAKPNATIWIDIEAPQEEDFQFLNGTFAFHPLAMEDSRKFTEFPKLEEYDNHVFVVFHKLFDSGDDIELREVDFFLGHNYLVSIHEKPSAIIRNAKEHFSHKLFHPDRLLHDFIDRMVDESLPLVSLWDEQLDNIEESIIRHQLKEVPQHILILKHKMAHARKIVSLQREVLTKLYKNEYSFVGKKTRYYFRDVYDHIISFHSELELLREVLASLFEAHLSAVSVTRNEISNRLNRTMERLAIISTIFLPLTFIASVYGMNFTFLPGAESEWGFFILVGSMLLMAAVLFYFLIKNLRIQTRRSR